MPTPYAQIEVKKDGVKVFSDTWCKEDHSDITLVTISGEEMGRDITAGVYTVTINGVSADIEVK